MGGVSRIEHITDLEDEQRDKLLQMTPKQMMKVAEACNRFPDLDVEFQVATEEIQAGENVSVRVILERDLDEDEELGFVFAPYYPNAQLEQWWVVIGEQSTDHLVAVKRVPVQRQAATTVNFTAPDVCGVYKYTLMIVCDSYVGCDQEYELSVNVEVEKAQEDEEMDDEADAMDE